MSRLIYFHKLQVHHPVAIQFKARDLLFTITDDMKMVHPPEIVREAVVLTVNAVRHDPLGTVSRLLPPQMRPRNGVTGGRSLLIKTTGQTTRELLPPKGQNREKGAFRIKKVTFFKAIIPSFPIFAPLKRTTAYQKFRSTMPRWRNW
jgi:hypothetical protein